eukprot:scaffold41844_cov46-Cyclotella_meneghiniana.AAC.4
MLFQQFRSVYICTLCLVASYPSNLLLGQAFSYPPSQHAGAISSRAPSHQHLFQSLSQKPESPTDTGSDNDRASSRSRIPLEDLSILNKGFGVGAVPTFPYTIDLLPKNYNDDKTIISNQATRLVVRHLEEEDITLILPEVVREFGSLMSQTNGNLKKPGDAAAEELENYLFSMTVLIGLTQRVKRRIKGYPNDISNCPDHNVICIVEQFPNPSTDSTEQPKSYSEQIVGIGELSWQPPNPNRNAPPFVLPYFIKQILAKFNPSMDENGEVIDAPLGYISNVLVYKNRRGLGYGRVLMAALEGIAKSWGCHDVRLHVDADEKSGRAAQNLYKTLGYAGVPDRRPSNKTSESSKIGYGWMGPSMANEGLYMVEGIPLLYMQKILRETQE